MITLKIAVTFVLFAGFCLETESACEESAILSKRLDHRFNNRTLGQIVAFENDFIGKSILCTNISETLDLKLEHPTRRRVSSFKNTNYYHRNEGYWEYQNTEEHEIPCHNFTIVDSVVPILPPSFLSSYPDIITLDLRSIHIKTIKPGAFKELTKLERLQLDGNEISIITVIFYSIDNLRVLTLSSNNITIIDFETVSLLKQLDYLDLSGNPIADVIPNSEDTVLSNLQTLLLNATLIKNFNNFSCTKELELLNLSSSHFTEVDFSLYPKVKTLDLSYNQIINITVNNEASLSKFVYLNHNNLREFSYMHNNVTLYLNVSNNELDSITACHLERLQTLDASHNLITTIRNDSFKEMFALLHLYLQNNLLTTIPVDSFRDLHALTHLDLSSNKILQFQSGTFNSLANLEYLNIQHNQLTSIFQLNLLVKLKELYADHNAITFNVVDLKLFFKYLKIISFSHNPWTCESLVRAYHELRGIDVVVAKDDSLDIDNLHGIACSNSVETSSVDPSEPVEPNEPAVVKVTAKDETLDQFFNFDFHKSKFYKYFDEDYAKSNFFSYLRNYKFVEGDNVAANRNNKNKSAELTSLVVKQESGGGFGVLAMLILMLLVIICLLLSCIMYLLYKLLLRDMFRSNQENILMRDGLIS